MLKKPSKATISNFDIHDCTFHVQFSLQKGWLTRHEDYKVTLADLFHHICHPIVKKFCNWWG